MKKLALAAFASIFIAIATGNVSSADRWPILERVEGSDPLQAALKSGGDAGVAYSIYWAVKVWPKQYRKLRVCFFGGTDEARSLIAEYAMDWMRPEHAMVFDFGEPGKQRTCDPNNKVESQVRIGFDDNQQMQTAGGVDAVVRYPQNVPSINLVGFGNVTRKTWLDAYHTSNIRHELGHVFALMHEHQSQNSPCEEEFDWEKIYAMANGNKEMIDNALRRLPGDQFVAGPFDVKSVMMYQFPPRSSKTATRQSATHLSCSSKFPMAI